MCFLLSCSGKSSLEVEGGGEVPKILLKVPLRSMAEPAIVDSVDVFIREVFDVDLSVDYQLVECCFVNFSPILWLRRWHWG